MNDWQPMDTAPKDGTFILIYSDDEDLFNICSWTEVGCQGPGWYERYNEYDTDNPTYWMPLPKLPEKKPVESEYGSNHDLKQRISTKEKNENRQIKY